MSDTTAAGTGPLTVLSAGAAALARADTLDQALDRSLPDPGAHNAGADGAAVAVEMVAVLRAATA